jgi:hypothetical protein
MHLAEPERALARMAAALRPEGWLLVEEGDREASVSADPVDRVHRLMTEAMRARGGIDLHLRQRCPELLAQEMSLRLLF